MVLFCLLFDDGFRLTRVEAANKALMQSMDDSGKKNSFRSSPLAFLQSKIGGESFLLNCRCLVSGCDLFVMPLSSIGINRYFSSAVTGFFIFLLGGINPDPLRKK